MHRLIGVFVYVVVVGDKGESPGYTSVLPTSKLINLDGGIDMSISQPYMQMKVAAAAAAPDNGCILAVKIDSAATTPDLSEEEEEMDTYAPSTGPNSQALHSCSPYIKTDKVLSVSLPMSSPARDPVAVADHKVDLLHGPNTVVAAVAASTTPPDNLLKYCRIGWDHRKKDVDLISKSLPGVSEDISNAPQLPSQNRTVGYVPHRHFENKMLKED